MLRPLSFAVALWVLVMLRLELWQAALCAIFGELLLAGSGWLFGCQQKAQRQATCTL